jgi:hypothetical protein
VAVAAAVVVVARNANILEEAEHRERLAVWGAGQY